MFIRVCFHQSLLPLESSRVDVSSDKSFEFFLPFFRSLLSHYKFFLSIKCITLCSKLGVSEPISWLQSQNIIVWSWTLNHTLEYLIFLSYIIIIKPYRHCSKTHFGSTRSSEKGIILGITFWVGWYRGRYVFLWIISLIHLSVSIETLL